MIPRELSDTSNKESKRRRAGCLGTQISTRWGAEVATILSGLSLTPISSRSMTIVALAAWIIRIGEPIGMRLFLICPMCPWKMRLSTSSSKCLIYRVETRRKCRNYSIKLIGRKNSPSKFKGLWETSREKRRMTTCHWLIAGGGLRASSTTSSKTRNSWKSSRDNLRSRSSHSSIISGGKEILRARMWWQAQTLWMMSWLYLIFKTSKYSKATSNLLPQSKTPYTSSTSKSRPHKTYSHTNNL